MWRPLFLDYEANIIVWYLDKIKDSCPVRVVRLRCMKKRGIGWKSGKERIKLLVDGIGQLGIVTHVWYDFLGRYDMGVRIEYAQR